MSCANKQLIFSGLAQGFYWNQYEHTLKQGTTNLLGCLASTFALSHAIPTLPF